MKYLIIGTLVFLGLVVALAPASLLDMALERGGEADLTQVQGSVWQGQGQLTIRGTALGQVRWEMQPLTLFAAYPTFDWQRDGPGHRLQGEAGAGFSTRTVLVSGTVSSESVNTWLAPYLITIEGDTQVSAVQIVQSHQQSISHLSGDVEWEGGQVTYQLSGLSNQSFLPPLAAKLTPNDAGSPSAVVTQKGAATPLIQATLQPDGFAKVGLTKAFLQILGTPWPGNDPETRVVIEVEEKII